MEFPADNTISGTMDKVEHLSTPCPPHAVAEPGQEPSLSTPAGVLPGWFVSIPATGSAKRFIQLLVAIDADPRSALASNGEYVSVGRADLRRRSIADRCGVRSEGTVGEWLDRWRARGWLEGCQFNLVKFAADHDVDRVGDVPSVDGPIPEAATGSTDTAVLSVLLDRLERAHVSKLDSLVSDLTGMIERVLDLAEENDSGPRLHRVSAVEPRVTAVDSRELVSEVSRCSNTTNYLATEGEENADAVRGERTADDPRAREEFLELVAPLIKLVGDRSLTGMRRSGGVEAALRPYSDVQVTDAVRTVCRMVRSDTSIRSPFGLLVSFARDGNPDVFGPGSVVKESVRSVADPSDFAGEPVDPAQHLTALRSQLRSKSSG